MKILSIAIVLSIAGVMRLPAQTANGRANIPEPTAYAVTTRDGNSQVWQRTTYEVGPDGKAIPRIHKYTELATGLNHLMNGQWVASDETITILPDGTAAAKNGQHQAYFPSDIYNGEIKLVTPDGRVLQSQPTGLSYDDGSNTVLIAVLTNSVGQLVSSNQIVYPNAFVGINADLRYTYTRAGFEQDVVLQSQVPDPASLGLNPQTARLQVLTEFFNSPSPKQIKGRLNQRNGLTDTTLQFGQMQMVQGKAFVVANNDSRRQKSSGHFSVYKDWVQAQGRNILIEELPYQQIATSLQALSVNTSMKSRSGHSLIGVLSKSLQLPPARMYVQKNESIQLAGKDSILKNGMVMDYDVVDSDQTNFTFQGDTTYYISAPVELSGTTTIEGGTVVKFSDSLSFWGINISGGINCKTGSYRPAIFTSMDDNSVGETISGSTGSGPGTSLGFVTISASSPLVLNNLRVCYAYEGLSVNSSYPVEFRNCQFETCAEPIYYTGYSGGLGLYNVLFANCEDAMEFSDGFDYIAENVTADASHGQLNDVDSGVQPAFISLTNCIINAFVDSDSTLLTNGVVINPGGPIFQMVGGGDYYLTNNSIYHNAGTTNIDPILLNDLAYKTTYPPIAYTNVTFSTAQTFPPQALRDNIGNSDLGYHYDPLDYTFGGCTITTNVTFSAGTAVGWFRTTSGWTHAGQGIQLSGNINVAFNGTVTSPDYWVRLNTVQENDQTAGYGHGSFESWASPPVPTVTGYFLHCTVMAGEVFNSYFADDYGTIQANMTHSEFWSGSLLPYGDYMNYTNCLLWRVGVGVNNGESTAVLTMRNCTMIGGSFSMNRNDSYGLGALPVSVRDCAFDGTSISTADTYGSNPSVTDYNYNAYTNNTDPFSIGGANDVKGTSFNWQSSWFGDYYQTTNSQLINMGDVTADQVGLYHFTTQTNQVPETNSVVDIGYHYVATDAYGNPLDTNGDGIPDYLEDANGNGVFDAGDLGNWLAPVYGSGSLNFTNGLHILVFEPKSGSQIP